MTSHLNQRQLLALVHGRLSPRAAEAAFGHVSFCRECALRLHVIRGIASDPNAAWDRFVARLERGTEEAPGEALRVAFRLILDGGRRLASLAGALLPEPPWPAGLRVEPLPAVRGVGHPADDAKVRRLLQEAGDFLTSGELGPARDRLAAAGAIAPEAVRSSSLRLMAGERVVALAVADSERRSVSVMLFESAAEAGASTRAYLVDPQGGDERQAGFRPMEEADYLLAEFEDVRDGAWILRLVTAHEAGRDRATLP